MRRVREPSPHAIAVPPRSSRSRHARQHSTQYGVGFRQRRLDAQRLVYSAARASGMTSRDGLDAEVREHRVVPAQHAVAPARISDRAAMALFQDSLTRASDSGVGLDQ